MYTDNNRCMDMNDMNMPKAEMHKDYNMGDMNNKYGMNTDMNSCCCPQEMPGVCCPPVYECPQERCCHREIFHEVPHIQPVKTRIINHHIYRHTFQPCFTCCEENVCSNVYEGPHCGC